MNVFILGFGATYEVEKISNYQNLDGQKGLMTGAGDSVSWNVPFYIENQHYLTDRLSVLAGFQAVYAQRQFIDRFLDSVDGDQSNNQEFYGFNPKVGLIHEFSHDDQAYINFSRSWQPPLLDETVSFNEAPIRVRFILRFRWHAWTLEFGTRGKEMEKYEWSFPCTVPGPITNCLR